MSNYLNGNISEVLIYKERALSAEEVKAMYCPKKYLVFLDKDGEAINIPRPIEAGFETEANAAMESPPVGTMYQGLFTKDALIKRYGLSEEDFEED